MQKQNGNSNKRAAILKATLDLVAANGFQGAPTSAIADLAGVGVGSIYRYFKDKEALIHEVFNELMETAKIEILNGYDSQAPFREQHICLCGNLFRYMYDYPKFFAFTEQYFNSPYGIQHKRIMIDKDRTGEEDRHAIAVFFYRAREQQVIKNLPIKVIIALALGPIIFLMRDIHNGLLEFSENLVQQVVEHTWEAIR